MKPLIVVTVSCLIVSYGVHADQVRYPTVAEPTGCIVEQITTADLNEYQVQGVSSDGRLLSYGSSRGEAEDGNRIQDVAYILDLATGTSTPLPARMNNGGNFSRDGQYVVAAAYDDTGRTEILELHIASGEISVIAPHAQWDWLPSYSADGRFIVFNSHRGADNADIYVYERATKDLRRLTSYPRYDAHAQFSPDGSQILFHRMMSEREDGGYDFDLFVYDLESSTETRLTDGPFEESYGAFAPDGRHIVFSSDVDEAPGQHNLFVLAPDGSTTVLTDGVWQDRYAYWTIDGKYIYFNSNRAGVADIYRIPMENTSCVRE